MNPVNIEWPNLSPEEKKVQLFLNHSNFAPMEPLASVLCADQLHRLGYSQCTADLWHW